MDETHLLEDGRLARVSGAKEEDLALIGWGTGVERIGREWIRTLTCFCILSFA